MLVKFSKDLILEGETTKVVKKHFWSKPDYIRKKIHRVTEVYGICDESEVAAEIERLTKKRLAEEGWGIDFSGWQKVLTFQECCQLVIDKQWSASRIPDPEPTIESIDHWTVERAAKELNGKQFAQYCRDYGIMYSK